jgi:glycosyltransferase involved in cell wall biosynthesis
MLLSVLIPTYNRHTLLRRALDSLIRAAVPASVEVRIIVVDNNSHDATCKTVEEYIARGQLAIDYVFERRQGRSFALNAGIAAAQGDLVAMIDDDEEVDERWCTVICSAFSNANIDFIGGPYIPRWGAPAPGWLPQNYLGAIGWVEGGNQMRAFDGNYPGILMGGNAVLTRSILTKVGPYSTSLGRSGDKLLSCEDQDMYERLLDAGAAGVYLPDLIIYHYVPPERLTKRYFRGWCFWRGVSRGVMDKSRRAPVAYLGGIPRYLYGAALRSAFEMASSMVRDRSRLFSNELPLWDLAGFLYGRHFYRQFL